MTEENDRRYSAASSATLSKLGHLDKSYNDMRKAVDEIAEKIGTGELAPDEMLQAKHKLAQLNGDLEKFQFTKVDAIETGELDSGKSEAKAHRKHRKRRDCGAGAAGALLAVGGSAAGCSAAGVRGGSHSHAYGGSGGSFDGVIAEMLLFDEALGDRHVHRIARYLLRKWLPGQARAAEAAWDGVAGAEIR